MVRIDIVTLFPEMFDGVVTSSILGRAQADGQCQIATIPLRSFGIGKHHQVDDRPFGGGAGMVLLSEVVFAAVESVKTPDSWVILTCPRGRRFTAEVAKGLAQRSHLILICGHYEGVDERIRDVLADEVISIGDYVLTGGELPAMVIIDATVRQIPGVLGNQESLAQGAFPQYTRPAVFREMAVPEVLLSGDHQKIAEWRNKGVRGYENG